MYNRDEMDPFQEETWCTMELLLNLEFTKVKHVFYSLPSYLHSVFKDIVIFKRGEKNEFR